MFIGRRKEIARLLDNIAEPTSSSKRLLANHGDHRIGRTSLLQALADKDIQVQHTGRELDNTTFEYVDLRFTENPSYPAVMGSVTSALFKKDSLDIDGLSQFVQICTKQNEYLNSGVRIVLLIDEFDACTGDVQVVKSLLLAFYFLTQNYDIVVIIGSRDSVLETATKFKGSPAYPETIQLLQ